MTICTPFCHIILSKYISLSSPQWSTVESRLLPPVASSLAYRARRAVQSPFEKACSNNQVASFKFLASTVVLCFQKLEAPFKAAIAQIISSLYPFFIEEILEAMKHSVMLNLAKKAWHGTDMVSLVTES